MIVGGGAAASGLTDQLSAQGYFCAVADGASEALDSAPVFRPDVVLFASPTGRTAADVVQLRADQRFADIPFLAEAARGRSGEVTLDVDDVIETPAALSRRLLGAIRARRALERESRARLRMDTLLEISQAATSSLELHDILSLAVTKLSRILPSDRCSVVLIEGLGPRVARVVASGSSREFAPLVLDLARYPELGRALETREPVYVEDVHADPLMAPVRQHLEPLGVRSLLVQPLVAQDETLGAVLLRLSRADTHFDEDDRAFARAVAATLSGALRNARLHAAVRRKREDLEAAYVDRYAELTEANRRLKELNRLKDEVVAVVSHDLRAPLQVLLGHGRLLQTGGLAADQKLSADAMVRTTLKILALVESLLERGKAGRAHVALNARELDVAELTKETVLELAVLAGEREVQLTTEIPISLMALADEVKLRQVVQNLVMNAIAHAPRGGRVTVRVHGDPLGERGARARVLVEDDGPGIAPDELRLVFDRYFHRGEGTGLGLAICKDYVELHGGEIWAENQLDGGCVFAFTVPLLEGARTSSAAPAALPAPESSGRVLVVEDEPEVASSVSELLRGRFRVDVARDGAEGIALAHAFHPDLIVMDVFLPKVDGLDALAALKSASDTRDIPVVMLSSREDTTGRLRELSLGAADYVHKPITGGELSTRVERVLAQATLERELSRSQLLLRQGGLDPATGLLDRSGLLARLAQELARMRRYSRPLVVAALSPEGPIAAPRSVAVLLKTRLRACDVPAHLGDGKLVLLFPEARVDALRPVLLKLAVELGGVTQARYRSSLLDAGERALSAEALLDELVPG